jgi:hypothetical protein
VEPNGRITTVQPWGVTVESGFGTHAGDFSGGLRFDVPCESHSGTIQFDPEGTVTVAADGQEREGTAYSTVRYDPVSVELQR